ncbi:MAG: 50S ribosomal protein L23 [Planctomycetes bacterium SM23_32]|nr:MAG: 50S ribosomal protein L23 [Planctomycetes bacterium SM23_32]
MDSHEIIVRPLHTEKSVDDIRGANTYHFEVDARATKTQIRHAVEELFPGRRVADVRTTNVKGKRRRVRWRVGTTRSWKKAIVRLRPGDTIDIGY